MQSGTLTTVIGFNGTSQKLFTSHDSSMFELTAGFPAGQEERTRVLLGLKDQQLAPPVPWYHRTGQNCHSSDCRSQVTYDNQPQARVLGMEHGVKQDTVCGPHRPQTATHVCP